MSELAIHQGDLHIVEILYSKKCPFDKIKCSIIAAEDKKYDIMDFLLSKNLLVFDYCYYECQRARVEDDVLYWLNDRGFGFMY
jgi:hypothetical protein